VRFKIILTFLIQLLILSVLSEERQVKNIKMGSGNACKKKPHKTLKTYVRVNTEKKLNKCKYFFKRM